jgi:predicted nucleic acid-binding protein
MSDRAFLDTNVIVYLFDGRVPRKQRAAGELLKRLVDERVVPVVSTQVLQEAYAALTRKLQMGEREALAALQMMEKASFVTEAVDAPLIWRSAARSAQDRISFWDALIVETARKAQCAVLYTEDLQDGRVFEGLLVQNPFSGSA